MTGEVVQAVGLGKKSGDASIQRRLRVVEGDMAALKHAFDLDQSERSAARAVTHGLLTDISDRLGKPKDHLGGATGIYYAVEAVSERVRPFEALWLQVKGSFKTMAVVVPVVALLLWFLAGDRITALLHG